MRHALCLLPVLLATPAATAELYHLSGDNTQISIAVRILGLTLLSARFEELSGELVPALHASPGRLEVTVRTASLVCESARWNARLLSPQWFDAQRYPQIVFRSDRVEDDGSGGTVVSGHLTLHGQTRSFDLTVNRWLCGAQPGPSGSCSFEAEGRIRRSDYGLPHGVLEGGDEVEIRIRGAGVRPAT